MSPLGTLSAMPVSYSPGVILGWEVVEFVGGYDRGFILGAFLTESEAEEYIARLEASFGAVRTDA